MSTPDALRRLIARAIAMHEVVAASLGINATDLRCLELLQEEPEVTPSRLAELAGLTTGAVTGVLDRLEASGFVRREADPADRRRIIVRTVPQRMAEVGALYERLLARASELGGDGDGRRYVDALVATLAGETDRLRVATEGGIIDNAYTAPMREVSRARLLLATGAPRLNLGGAALGQQVRMVAETAATRLTLRAGDRDRDPRLIRADFIGPPPDVRTTDGTVTMRYRRRVLDTRSREINAALHPDAAWGIEIDGGITDLVGDLRGLELIGIEVRAGANHVALTLPRPVGLVRIAISGGTSDARFRRPSDVPVSLVVRGGASHLRFDGERRSASATDLRMSSQGWSSAPDRYQLELAGGAAHLAISGD